MIRPLHTTLLATLFLGACGFHPLYLPDQAFGGPAATGAAAEGLSTIYVPVIVNREGQLMRQALQRRFDGSGAGVARKYDILAQPIISSEAIGVLRDNSTTRYRLNGSVTWYLRKLDVAHTIVAQGTARIVDGANVFNQQYFALDLELEAVNRRIVEALADQVTQQVAIYLRRQAQTPNPTPGTAPSTAPASLAPAIPPGNPGALPDILSPTGTPAAGFGNPGFDNSGLGNTGSPLP